MAQDCPSALVLLDPGQAGGDAWCPARGLGSRLPIIARGRGQRFIAGEPGPVDVHIAVVFDRDQDPIGIAGQRSGLGPRDTPLGVDEGEAAQVPAGSSPSLRESGSVPAGPRRARQDCLRETRRGKIVTPGSCASRFLFWANPPPSLCQPPGPCPTHSAAGTPTSSSSAPQFREGGSAPHLGIDPPCTGRSATGCRTFQW